jgi:hypothetical protein
MSDRGRTIAIEALTHFDACASGQHIEIGFMDHGGKPGRLYLSPEALGSLLPSLAAALQEARAGSAGSSGDRRLACAAQPLLDWRLARANDEDVIVLRLKASNAVEIAFRLPAPAARALGQALLKGCTPLPLPPARLLGLTP